MKLLILLLLAVFAVKTLCAVEPRTIAGTIVEHGTGEPVAGAIIKAGCSFSSSDASGRFSLVPESTTDSVVFRCMGYETMTLPQNADFSKVILHAKDTELKDVIVEAPDIYAKGDTLVFNVGRYSKPEDNAIIDVIKRLPGIKVEEDGTILYQGKPINKFYLDGNDFVGGQYGLATENISYKDVASVEVMENHQPVKALEGIEFPEEAGINLRLKEDARLRPAGVVQAANGAEPVLYGASLFTMYLARKLQSMLTLKIDNTGWNPTSQITDHDFDRMFSDVYIDNIWPNYISADKVNTPLAEKRTRDNLSYLANVITAWKSGDTSMRVKMNCLGDRLDYATGLTTDYLNSNIPDFVENKDIRTHRRDLSAEFYAEINKRGYYLKDKCTVDAAWDKSVSDVSGSSDIYQRERRDRLSAQNDLRLVKRNDKKVFTFTSRNSFSRTPDRLFLFGERDACQRISSTDIRSTTEGKFGKLTRFWKYYIETGIDFNYRHQHFSLSGMNKFDNTGRNPAWQLITYATPQIDFERGSWRLSFEMPLRWQHLRLNGSRDFANVLPGVYVKRQLTSKSDISFSTRYSLLSPMPYLYIGNPILQDFRHLFVARPTDRYSHNVSSSLSFRYRNPLSAMFFNLSASYIFRKNSQMTDEIFVDDIIVSTFANRFSDSRTWQTNAELSKGLAHSRIVLGYEAGASHTSASSMRNTEAMPYEAITATCKPYFKGCPVRWFSMSYDALYSFSDLKIDSEKKCSHTFRQNIAFTAYPHDSVQLTLGAEHYLTRFPEGNSSSLALLDASAAWQFNGRLRLTLTADNLLGKRFYRYITYGTLSSSEHLFQLRPRKIMASLQYRF